MICVNSAQALIFKKQGEPEVQITSSYQASYYEDEDGNPKFNWFKTDIARNEGFAVLLNFHAKIAQVSVTEYVEMASAAKWETDIDQQCEVSNDLKKITCSKLIDNTGSYISSWLLLPSDPVGPVKVVITIGDAEPIDFHFRIEEGINLFVD